MATLLNATLHIKGCEDKAMTVTIHPRKPNCFVLQGVPFNVDETAVHACMKTILGDAPYKIHVERKEPEQSKLQEMVSLKAHINRFLNKTVNLAKAIVRIFKPQKSDVYLKGDILFEDFRMMLSGVEQLERVSVGDIPISIVSAERFPKINLRIENELYGLVSYSIQEMGSDYQEDLKMEGPYDLGDYHHITLTCADISMLNQCLNRCEKILKPEVLTMTSSQIRHLSSNEGEAFIKLVCKDNMVSIKLIEKTNECQIFGRYSKKHHVKNVIKKYHTDKERWQKVSFEHVDSTRTLQEYVRTIQGMKTDLSLHGVSDIEYCIRDKMILVKGDDSCCRYLEERLNMKEVPAEEVQKEVKEKSQCSIDISTQSGEADCPVCLCPIEGKSYQLKCEHVYCLECIKEHMTMATKSKSFPVACISDCCNVNLSVQDILHLCQLIALPKDKLLHLTIVKYVNANPTKYHFCSYYQCGGMCYRLSQSSPATICSRCSRRHCQDCKRPYHHGWTCRQFADSFQVTYPSG